VAPAAVERHLTRIFTTLGPRHEAGRTRRVLAVLAFLRS
jgi:hypothetical protein